MKQVYFMLFSLLITVSLSSCEDTAAQTPPEPNDTISNNSISIPVYDESQISYFLNKKDGKVHIVNFWATWCAPCVKELPYFEQVNEEYSNDDVEITLVSLDFEHQLESKLLPYVERNLKNDVIVVIPNDEQKFIETVSKNWQTGAIPATLIYNDNKSYFIEGETTYDELTEHIQNFQQ